MPPRDEFDEASYRAGEAAGKLGSLEKSVTEMSRQIDALFSLQRKCLAENCEPIKARLAVAEAAVSEIPELSRRTMTLWVIGMVVVFALGAFGARIVSAMWPEKSTAGYISPEDSRTHNPEVVGSNPTPATP